MSAISLQDAKDQLSAYLAAEKAVLGSSQQYEIAGRKLTRANLAEIRDGVRYWMTIVEKLDRATSGRSRRRTLIVGG